MPVALAILVVNSSNPRVVESDVVNFYMMLEVCTNLKIENLAVIFNRSGP
jgi:hypothetical protein